MKIRILFMIIGIFIGAYVSGFFTSQTVNVYYYNYTSQAVCRQPVNFNGS